VIEEKLIYLKKQVIDYSGLVESMVNKSLRGLIEKNKTLLLEVIAKDENEANHFDLLMDDLCTTLIAQYQPKAKNLRIILMVLKMSTDLERMADHAVNIAESGLFLIERPDVKPLIDLPRMGELTIRMLRDGINSFLNEDAVMAKSVCIRDSEVDEIKDSIQTELTNKMVEDPSTVKRALHLLRISGNLERIADLSTNICEEVLYMSEGRIIKHHAEDKTVTSD
jgi:phosphate transport system protein